MTLSLAAVQAPEIDYQALAPLMATAGGSIVVLMIGLFRGRLVQTVLVPALAAVALLAAIGLTIWNWEPGDVEPIIQGALEVDTLALGLSMLFYVAGAGLHRCSRCAPSPPARPATASTTRCCSARSPA